MSGLGLMFRPSGLGSDPLEDNEDLGASVFCGGLSALSAGILQ